MARKRKVSFRGQSPADKLDWTVILRNKAPLTISRKNAYTIKDLAAFLHNMGVEEEDIMGVLRSTTKAQAMITALTVKRIMRK